MIELSPLRLNARHAMRRIPGRQPVLREAGFDEKFDGLTVFYDVFLDPMGKHVICVGPPLWNLRDLVLKSLKSEFKTGFFSRFRVLDLDRCTEVRFRPKNLSVGFPHSHFTEQSLTVQANHSDLFKGRRVIYTLSKDNDLAWIRDWAAFYVANHGADAVLLYDNASKSYNAAKVKDVLLSVNGIKTAAVVDWPYKYGPVGYHNEQWDSQFSQHGVFEHARWRFLAKAEGAINADIDELAVTKSGERIFDLLAQSKTGYLCYPGIWMENATEAESQGVRRHRDFKYTTFFPATRKWAVDPRRCGISNQWATHWVAGMKADALSADISLRHFKGISTDWDFRRAYPEQPTDEMVREEIIAEWMERVP